MDEAPPQRPPAAVLPGGEPLRIGILLTGDTAAAPLADALAHVPPLMRPRVSEVFVSDPPSPVSSPFAPRASALSGPDLPITVISRGRRRGYGGVQKAAYRLAVEHGLGIVVLVPSGLEAALAHLEALVAPLDRGEAAVVVGSPVLRTGGGYDRRTRRGADLVDTLVARLANRVLRTRLSDFRPGLRAYHVRSLEPLPFERNSDDYSFDAQILVQLVHSGRRLTEVPIGHRRGGGSRQLPSLTYARKLLVEVARYSAAKRGLLSGSVVDVGPEYQLKEDEGGSHRVVTHWLERVPPARILDLGCSGGLLGASLRRLGHHVTGVDLHELPGILERVDRFVRADLDQGLPPGLGDPGTYDLVIAADVLEHLRAPERLLDQLRPLLAPGGSLIVSVPNFAHWYPRVRTALGLFDYDQRGILDSTHIRFFTRRSFLRLLRQAHFRVIRRETTGLPLEVLTRGNGPITRAARACDRLAVNLRPTLFAYQFVYECRRDLTD